MFKGACTGTDRHVGSIEEERGLLTLDQVKGSNKGTSIDGRIEWMDGHYMFTHLHAKERHSVERTGKGKVDTPVQGHIFLKRSASRSFFRPGYMCVAVCVRERVFVFRLEGSWFGGLQPCFSCFDFL